MGDLVKIRGRIRALHRADEQAICADLTARYAPSIEERARISDKAARLIEDIRAAGSPGLMEVFLAEYGLSTDEGIALMCLAEALLRVPDAATMDDLIEDKIAPSAWGAHLGRSSSSLVNASTWALMLTGKVLKEPATPSLSDTLRSAIKRLGEPVIRTAVKRAMQEMGRQFVLGETIEEAINRSAAKAAQGFTYSYDMLGEAALTARDAEAFFKAYADAITRLAAHAKSDDVRGNPGISIKLSALHPRYELTQKGRVMDELVPRVKALVQMAKDGRMGLNIDAEEADRLDLSLNVIEAVLSDPTFAGWDGFGVVVQAYGKRASAVIDWLHALAQKHGRKIMVRLVKGAYWDTEIKRAQVDGLADFPVFTRKKATDISYICCAKKLLAAGDDLYPQFATHNAHTVAAILTMAGNNRAYEFQRLHGMGETLFDRVVEEEKVRARIYAPVGAHRDLLAYLVRRLLENGANSSFVNQIVDPSVPAREIAADPFVDMGENKHVQKPADLYAPDRVNAAGWDLRNHDDLKAYEVARAPFQHHVWNAGPLAAMPTENTTPTKTFSPQDPSDHVGNVVLATQQDAEAALDAAQPWATNAGERRHVMDKIADLYEANSGEFFAALAREAGKTAPDAVAEIREAVDFLRFYANEAMRLADRPARGLITCISPWNFPLAIFTGQITAALAAGNGVLAKPAEPTPIVAHIAVRLMHEAGVPKTALQLLPGLGAVIGEALTTDPRIKGICFTGSTGVAQKINQAAAKALVPDAMFIAETGGLNAMIVDSTALLEQAVKDVVDSAFRSCGQRCSALRMLYVQEDIAEDFLAMLFGAMDELCIGDPWDMASDIGPVIAQMARQGIVQHIEQAYVGGRVMKAMAAPNQGIFVGPTVIKVDGIEALEREIFGPVLHVATFNAQAIEEIIDDINASGYGLTFGLHTRIDDRVEKITRRLKVGNMYVNRNQIGAVVESQPFGGEGLSGTGPKAGGPHYVARFKRASMPHHTVEQGDAVDFHVVQEKLSAAVTDLHKPMETRTMPGPTGESNRWSLYARGTILCLGPTKEDAIRQMAAARDCGCAAVAVVPDADGDGDGAAMVQGFLQRPWLKSLQGFAAVALWSDHADLQSARIALSDRDGPLIPLIATDEMTQFCTLERHLCIDTTAAGGNASLLAAQ